MPGAVLDKLKHALSKNRSFISHTHFPVLTFVSDGKRPSTTRAVLAAEQCLDAHHPVIMSFHCPTWRDQQLLEGSRKRACEACIYFPKTRNQFRLSGKATMQASCSDQSKASWAALLQDGPRFSQFAVLAPWAVENPLQYVQCQQTSSTAGRRTQQAEGEAPLLQPQASSINQKVPDDYVYITLQVDELDYLSLKNPQTRIAAQRSVQQQEAEADSWSEVELNP